LKYEELHTIVLTLWLYAQDLRPYLASFSYLTNDPTFDGILSVQFVSHSRVCAANTAIQRQSRIMTKKRGDQINPIKIRQLLFCSQQMASRIGGGVGREFGGRTLDMGIQPVAPLS
jgi:hypothetical protein